MFLLDTVDDNDLDFTVGNVLYVLLIILVVAAIIYVVQRIR